MDHVTFDTYVYDEEVTITAEIERWRDEGTFRDSDWFYEANLIEVRNKVTGKDVSVDYPYILQIEQQAIEAYQRGS